MTWNTSSSLSKARYGLAGASAGDVVLFAGGYDSSGECDTIDIYNHTLRSWSVSATPLSVARSKLAATSLKNEIVMFAGGQGSGGNSATIDIFNLMSELWTTGALAVARRNLAGASYDDFAIFAGGYTSTSSDAVDIYRYSTATWSTASLCGARENLAGASSNGFIMFAGAGGLATMDFFDTNTEIWSSSNLKNGREDLVGIGTSEAVYFAGGNLNSVQSNVIDSFYTGRGSASELAVDRSRLTAASSSFSEGVIIFAGGYGADGCSRTVEVYEGDLDEWGRGFLYERRSDLSSAAIDEFFLFAGGMGEEGVSDVVDMYDHSNRMWTVGNFSEARSLLAAASASTSTSLGKQILVGGGYNGSSASAVVDLYNVSSSSWYLSVPLSVARYELAASSVEDIIIFAGGWDGNDCFDAVDVYNASSGNWTTDALSEARRRLAGESYGDVLLFAGGYNGTAYSALVDIYNQSADSWTSSTLSEPRESLSAASSSNGFVVFAGGIGDGGVSSAVDIFDAYHGGWDTKALNSSRSFLAGVGLGDAIYFAGGVDGAATYSLIEKFNTSNWNASYPSRSSSSLSQSGSSMISSSTSSPSSTSTPSGSSTSSSTSQGSSSGSQPDGILGLLKLCTDSPICILGIVSFLFIVLLVIIIIIIVVIIVIIAAVLGTGTTVAVKTVRSKSKSSSFYNPQNSVELELTEDYIELETSSKPSVGSVGAKDSSSISIQKMTALATDERAVVDASEVTIGKMIGKGEFGKTYLAEYLGAPIVVKQSSQGKKGIIENSDFLREAATMVDLRHPNIVQFIGLTLEPLNILMEYIPDGDVESLVKKEKLQPNQLIHIAKGAAAGVLCLHSHNMVHGDLAARNLLVRKDSSGLYTVKVSDFGLSSMFSAGTGAIGVSGKFAIPWCAPEMLTNHVVTTASDVYAFGMTLYEIFEGKRPFAKTSNSNVMEKVKAGERPKISKTPFPIAKVIEMCWTNSPMDRPMMSVVLNHLKRIEEEEEEESDEEVQEDSFYTDL